MLAELTQLMLSSNVFEFNGILYLQTPGMAMGTRMPLVYANIFISQFEGKHLLNTPFKPILWKRYIDDILAPV